MVLLLKNTTLLADKTLIEEIPTYYKGVIDIVDTYKLYHQNHSFFNLNDLSLFLRTLHQEINVQTTEIFLVLFLAVFFTVLRYFTTILISAPIASYLKINGEGLNKFPESFWKVFYYSITWSVSLYILVLSKKHDYFFRPSLIWNDWDESPRAHFDLYALYAVQFSFYLHSVYATLYMDVRRKDFVLMLVHHILTMCLIGFSFAVRYHKIGLLVLFCHDISDIFLEFTKCNIYLQRRNKQFYKFNDWLSTLGFIGFGVSWFVFRLYFFPLKVIYSSAVGSVVYLGKFENFYVFFNGMLLFLQCLNIYWFMFILAMVYKIVTGQMNRVDDIREEDVVEANRTKKKE